MTNSLTEMLSLNSAGSRLEETAQQAWQDSSLAGAPSYPIVWLGTRDQWDVVSLQGPPLELCATISGAGEILTYRLDRCMAESDVPFISVVPWDWPDLPPRLVIETLAGDFFGASATVRYYRLDGEDRHQDVAEIEADVTTAEQLAELEERLLSRIVESHPRVLDELTVVCHRR